MTFAEAEITFIVQLADNYDRDEAKSIFRLLTLHHKGYTSPKTFIHRGELLTQELASKLLSALGELKTGRPVQHIIGTTEFYGLTFKVDGSVLIPRPETEELVDWIIRENRYRENGHLIDIGTGSGCIAVSLKKNLPNLTVDAIDISESALKIAKANAILNEVEVKFLQADILQADADNLSGYDIIVSNPPYIRPSEAAEMNRNVLDFEPHTALFATEEDPLIFYRKIGEFALKHLNAGGQLFLEINSALGNETTELLNRIGFRSLELRKDMQGADRMIRCLK